MLVSEQLAHNHCIILYNDKSGHLEVEIQPKVYIHFSSLRLLSI